MTVEASTANRLVAPLPCCTLALLAAVLAAPGAFAASAYRMPDSFYEVGESVVTPHIAWAKPYYGGPVKALIIAPRWTQRETIELAQRLSLDYTTCMTWLSNRLGCRIDRGIGSRAQGAMPQDVTAEVLAKLKRDYDVIVVGNVDWRILPREVEYAILKKVHDGTGLVCANHRAGRTKTLDAVLASEPVRDDAGFITHGVPLEALPALGLRERGGEGIGEIIALRRLKRGRVAFLGYPEPPWIERGRMGYLLKPKLPRFTFLTPAMGFVGERELLHYEYYLSLGIKTMLWAAGRGPAVHIESVGPDDVTLKRDELAQAVVTIATRSDRALQGTTVRLVVRDELGKEEHDVEKSLSLQQGRSAITFPMPSLKAGRHFLDASIKKDGKIVNWGSSCFDVKSDVFVREVALEKASYEKGDEVRGKVVLNEPAGHALKVHLSVVDTLGRVTWTRMLAAGAREIPFAFRLDRPTAIVQNVTGCLIKGDDVIAEARQEFSVRLRNWDDHSFMIWGYDFGPYSPTEYWVLRQLRGWGVDTISNCAPHPELARGIALANLYAIPYATRYSTGKVGDDLVRRPCLTDSSWQKDERERLIERAKVFAPYGPFAYSLGDENFLGRSNLDICFSQTCQADLRKCLQREYGDLQDLNEEYGTRYEAWEQVKPVTLVDARNEGTLPLWADHRMHMEEVFVGAHRVATDTIKSVDPTARVGFDGPAFWLSWSWSGMNWWEFAKFFDLLNLYSGQTVGLEVVRSFAKKGTIVCSWYGGYFYGNRCGSGWQRNEDMQRFFPWWMAFHRGTATAWYNSWGTIENGMAPDLSAFPCFGWAIEEANELKAGVGKLLMNAERLHDGIAVHYSQASVHASTIDHSLTSISTSQRNFLVVLEDLGLQYEYLSYEQIESGALMKERWRVLVLPHSQALSGKEAEGIRGFVRSGGLVLADLAPGVMDEHCKRLPGGFLDDVFGVKQGAARAKRTGKADISATVDAVRFEAAIPDAVVDGSLTLTTAEALGKTGATPVVTVNEFGNGKAVLLNLALDHYETLRKAGSEEPIKNLLRRVLEIRGVRSRIKLTTEAGELKGCETVFFRDGPIEYVGLLRSHVAGEPISVQARMALPQEAHVYDVRAKRFLGFTKAVETSMRAWRAQLYALLPYRVNGMKLATGKRVYHQGDVVVLKATLNTSAGKVGTHCIRLTVSGPDGASRPYYSQNVLSEDGKAVGEIPLALNDQPGRWRFVAEDVVSGTKEVAEVELRRRADVALGEGPDEKMPAIRQLPPHAPSAKAALPTASSRVGVSVGKLTQRPVGHGPLKGKTYRARAIPVTGTPFSLRWMDVVDEQGKHQGYEEGYIGMPEPSAQNWYHGGFLFFSVNGRDLGSVPVSDVGVVEQGARGSVCMVWETPEAKVQARFLVLAGDDRLFVEIALKPKTEIKSLRVETVCYPSLFTSARKMPGRRHVISPTKEAWQRQPFRIDPAKDWWLLYADDVHDVAKGSGIGPCAMAFLPEQVSGGSISIGSYPVRTRLDVNPNVRRIRLVFWDLRGMTNADAQAKMRKDAPAARSHLEEMDFTILAVATLDVAKRRSEIGKLIQSCGGERKFAPIFRPLLVRLEDVQARLRKQKRAGGPVDPAAERELTELLHKLAEAEWDLKFHAVTRD